MIQRLQQCTTFRKLAKAIETYRIEPLEDVAVLAVLRRAAMLFDKPLDLLEAGDDALLARRAARRPLRLGLDAKLFEKCVIFVGELSHGPLPPSCGPETPPPPPCASPRHRAR
jgi:hypothetical protein